MGQTKIGSYSRQDKSVETRPFVIMLEQCDRFPCGFLCSCRTNSTRTPKSTPTKTKPKKTSTAAATATMAGRRTKHNRERHHSLQVPCRWTPGPSEPEEAARHPRDQVARPTTRSSTTKSSTAQASNHRHLHLVNTRVAQYITPALSLMLLLLLMPSALITLVSSLESSQAAAEQPFVFKHNQLEKDSDFWLQSGRSALDAALKYQPNLQRAKSSIIFIGDGMSLTTITAARILQGQLMNKSGEEEQLAFDQLHNVALIKTYNIDQQVPDSAATATAILTGVKANFYTLGVNGNVRLNDTNCSRIQANQVNSIIKMAQEAGKSTGIITNTRITHATPAAAYAHVSNRRWECDAHVPRNLEPPCKDIARQLIEDEPGHRLNVIMGGGRRCFFGPNFIDPGPTGQPGMRQDQLNLIDKWIGQRRENHEQNYAFVNSTQDLRLINVDKTDYLLGLFSYSHMSYEELRDTSRYGEPSLAEMTEVALKILSKNPLGYVLLVEGGRIDHAHHENVAGVALRETISLSWAVQAARQLVDTRDTLLAVTSDHAHALTINGLAPRGNPILGLSRYKENSTQLPYTTLIYGNGPGNQRARSDPTVGPNSTDSPYYVQYAAIHQEEAFHDGSDVAIFASGPFAHLFQGVQEQSYIAHVFAYAMCIGDYQSAGGHCRNEQAPASSDDPGDEGPARTNARLGGDQTFDASTRAHTFLMSKSPSLGRTNQHQQSQWPASNNMRTGGNLAYGLQDDSSHRPASGAWPGPARTPWTSLILPLAAALSMVCRLKPGSCSAGWSSPSSSVS